MTTPRYGPRSLIPSTEAERRLAELRARRREREALLRAEVRRVAAEERAGRVAPLDAVVDAAWRYERAERAARVAERDALAATHDPVTGRPLSEPLSAEDAAAIRADVAAMGTDRGRTRAGEDGDR